jgi:hypothetical protein
MMPTPGVVRIGAALAWSGIVRLLPSAAPSASWPHEVDRVTHAFLPLVVLSAGRAKDAESLRAMGLTPEQGARL